MTLARTILAALLATAIVGSVVVFLAGREGGDRPSVGGIVEDELIRADLSDGVAEDVAVVDGGLVLRESSSSGFPRRGRWISAVMPVDAFTELLPSWNADCPPGTGVRFSARTMDGYTRRWSPWLDYGYWGKVPPPVFGESFDGGAVAVDILELDRPAVAVQVRVDFFGYALDKTDPKLDQLKLAVRRGTDLPPTDRPTPAVDLPVPFIPQRTAGDRIGGEICSPTSTTMVAAFHGASDTTAPTLVENAMAIYDTEHGIFGNWNRAVQRAAELGLAGHLERFSTWPQVEAHLRAGRPIIASINFASGQAPSFVMDATAGHLIVVRGIDADGHLLVNDAASADHGE
ncbi:MAG: C39 family peptidase, partial [Planctomycetota bacterium]